MKHAGHRLEKQLGPKYRIDALLGNGGMGEVWAATDMELDRPVAIKVLSTELSSDEPFVERFRRESKVLALFAHPRIVRILSIGTLPRDRRLYMVMERLHGKTLQGVMEEQRGRGTPFDWVSSAFFALQMLDGLRAAHAKGVIHRDVKPENMIVNEQGYLTLLDFGVAKAADVTGPQRDGAPAGATRPVTHKSTLLGTPRFMAPEVILRRGVDARSDLYAVGIILVMLLTDLYPYDVGGRSDTRILEAHVHDDPELHREKNPDCPEELWAIAAKLLEKDPGDRFESAGDAAAEIGALLRGSVPPSHAMAELINAHRKDEAHRKAYETRGAPSTRPPAAVQASETSADDGTASRTAMVPPPGLAPSEPGPDVTKPLPYAAVRRDVGAPFPVAPPAPARPADITKPIPDGVLPPPMPEPFPLARPASAPSVDLSRPPAFWRSPAERRARRDGIVIGVLATLATFALLVAALLAHTRSPVAATAVPGTTTATVAPGSASAPAVPPPPPQTPAPVVTVEPSATTAPVATAAPRAAVRPAATAIDHVPPVPAASVVRPAPAVAAATATSKPESAPPPEQPPSPPPPPRAKGRLFD